jgi:hypothetical protein
MTNPLDVLVIESHPGASDRAREVLTSAGHRVHRCFDGRALFPCVGVANPDACPLERGVDVALAVRRGVIAWPTPLEAGVGCALRAGVPVLQEGSTTLDPFEPWLTGIVGNDVPGACRTAARVAYDGLCERIERGSRQAMARAGHPGPVTCTAERHGDTLDVTLSGPPVGKDVVHALAVRALDAVHAERRRFAEVAVRYATV